MESEIVLNREALTPEVAAALGGIVGVSMTVTIIFGLFFAALRIIARWKVFKKAGKPGWHCLIPVLSDYDEVDLCWNRQMACVTACLSAILLVLSAILNGQDPQAMSKVLLIITGIFVVVFLVIACLTSLKMAKAFGKNKWFGVGLFFFREIFMLILGFGNAEYKGQQG